MWNLAFTDVSRLEAVYLPQSNIFKNNVTDFSAFSYLAREFHESSADEARQRLRYAVGTVNVCFHETFENPFLIVISPQSPCSACAVTVIPGTIFDLFTYSLIVKLRICLT